jgi:hypothetical protein
VRSRAGGRQLLAFLAGRLVLRSPGLASTVDQLALCLKTFYLNGSIALCPRQEHVV